jgi:glycosyltransferase involved in cell wall biosynthesis
LDKAIVASDLPVFRELLTNRENALLVNPQDSTELAAALIELTRDPVLRERLAQKVREMSFGDQSWLLIAEKTMQTYESTLARSAEASIA